MKKKRCYDIGGALSSMGNLVTSWDELTKAKSTLPYESAYDAMTEYPFSGDMSQLEAQYRSLNTDPEVSRYQLGYLTPSEANKSLWGSALSGAGTGFSVGSTFGPWGMLAGTVLGGVAGGLLGNYMVDTKNNNAEETAERMASYRDSAMKRRRSNFKSAVSLADSNNDRWLSSQYAAFGGPLQTNGTIWDTGYTSIEEGGSHETNPYGGIQIGIAADGQPNLVEEDEKIMNIQGSPFVFSARSIVDNPEEFLLPKQIKGKSFAEASEWLYEHLGMKDNPNNPINKRGNTAMQERLAAMQEIKKQPVMTTGNTFATGGLPYDNSKGFKYWNGNSYDADYLNWLNNRDWAGVDKPVFDELSAYYKQYYPNATLTPEKAIQLGQDKKFGRFHQVYADLYDKYGKTPEPPVKAPTTVTSTQPTPLTPINNYWAIDAAGNKIALTESEFNNPEGLKLFEYPNATWRRAEDLDEDFTDPNGQVTRDLYLDILPANSGQSGRVAATPTNQNNKTTPVNTYPTWMRYAPVIGSGLNVLGDIFGLTNVPDYTNADLIHNSVLRPEMIGYQPTGRYMRYNPIDKYNLLNRLEAQSTASTSAAKDLSGGNRATALANIAAQEYANQVALGELGLNIANQDAAQRQAITTHNNKVDQDNANRALDVAKTNQSAFERYASRLMEARVREAMLRDQIDREAASARSTNWNTFLTNLGAVGKENMAANMVNTNPANYYSVNRRTGEISYKGGYDNLDEATKKAVKREAEKESRKVKKQKEEAKKSKKQFDKVRRGIYFDPLDIMD